MKRRALVLAAVAAALTAAPAGMARAAAETVGVGITQDAFTPPRVVALAGDTVGWRNGSFREHTVTGDGFDSGRIVPGGGYYHEFDAAGSYPYVCTIHQFMSGTVVVERLLLSGPSRAVGKGSEVTLSGRAASGISAVKIEEDRGSGYQPVGSAQVANGTFRATVRPGASALYRAVSGADSSPPVSVTVTDRSALRLSRAGRRLRVSTDPALPGALVALQLRLRERFGWWIVARRRLDRNGRTSFPIRRRRGVRVRAELLRPDGWTPISTSNVVRVLPRR